MNQLRKEVLLLPRLPESTGRSYLHKEACRCDFMFVIPSVNQRDQQVHDLICKEVTSFHQGIGKEEYSLKMAFSLQKGPPAVLFHDAEFLPAQCSEEESLCSLYGEAKLSKHKYR